MNTSAREPCACCPYRKDAPLRHWDKAEFVDLLAADADPMGGAVYGCHNHAKLPPEERGPCVGWLIDQRERGVPSIKLRLKLTFGGKEAAEQFNEARAPEGVELYPSIKAMCRANGVRPPRGRSRP